MYLISGILYVRDLAIDSGVGTHSTIYDIAIRVDFIILVLLNIKYITNLIVRQMI